VAIDGKKADYHLAGAEARTSAGRQ
jgi:hypothetical protein